MIYGYIRVSTRTQLEGNGLEVQKNAILNKYPDAIIVEEQFSGKTMDRPKFNELIKELKENDKLVLHKLDRMSRTTLDGMKLMETLIQDGIEVEVLNFGEVVGGFTSSNKLMFQILMAFAEYERDCIVERTQAGKEIAKQNPDFREGRPVLYTESRKKHALDLLKSGKTYREVEKDTGISKSTLIRYKRKLEEEEITKQLVSLKEKELKKEKQVKKAKTNREKIEDKLNKEGLVIGCYDELVDKLTLQQLKKVLESMEQEATDVHVKINRKKFVVEINTVDNEKDFSVIDINEYISRYGELEE